MAAKFEDNIQKMKDDMTEHHDFGFIIDEDKEPFEKHGEIISEKNDFLTAEQRQRNIENVMERQRKIIDEMGQ